MKRALLFSFLGAAGCHALLLFGFQVSEPVLHPVGDSGAMDVALMGEEEGAPPAQGSEAASETAPTPPAEPPAETPPPQPEPADPVPSAEPEPAEPAATPSPTPVPDVKPAPRPARSKTSATAHHGAPSAPASQKTGAGTGTGNGLTGAGAAAAGVGGGGQPRYRSHPRPEYPPQARRDRQEGVVYVNVRVGTDGIPSEVTLARSSGFPLLDEAALKGVKRWTFDPATAAGVPVSSQVEVPVRFNLLP